MSVVNCNTCEYWFRKQCEITGEPIERPRELLCVNYLERQRCDNPECTGYLRDRRRRESSNYVISLIITVSDIDGSREVIKKFHNMICCCRWIFYEQEFKGVLQELDWRSG